VKGLNYISNYVDDSLSCNLSDATTFYQPYGINCPNSQALLLQLWDELGIPHKPHKQVSGSPLTIIGIQVDPNLMTLTLPNDVRTSLINKLQVWTTKPPKTSSGSFKLKHWQRMAGWFNWALNVYLLLHPALRVSGTQFKKMGSMHPPQLPSHQMQFFILKPFVLCPPLNTYKQKQNVVRKF
jgi:hypothetical protein